MSELDLVDRLRGIYKIGPDGEYGKRDFSEFVPAISLEAADEIERLKSAIAEKDREIERYRSDLYEICNVPPTVLPVGISEGSKRIINDMFSIANVALGEDKR